MKVSITTCDGCGSAAPDDYSRMFPSTGWIALSFTGANARDICSPKCLATVAFQLGAPMAGPLDDLEQILALSSVMPIRGTKAPRKPRKAL